MADAYWKRFSDRIMAAYVTGSHAGGYAVPGSDIDLVFVLAGAVTEQDRNASAALTKELHGTTRLGLDLDLVGSNDAVRPALKLDSVLVRGSDVRDRLSVMPLTDWIAERRYAACWLMSHLFGGPGIAQIPLAFPDEAGEFFGYNTDRGGVSDGPEGSTKDLVRSTSWAATALVATESECFLTSKLTCWTSSATICPKNGHATRGICWTSVVARPITRSPRAPVSALGYANCVSGRENSRITTYPAT